MSADWLLDWVETGTTATGEVVTYGNVDAVNRYTVLADELEEAEANPDLDTLSGPNREAKRIQKEMDRILVEELEPTKVVWTVRALDDEEIREISEEMDFPAPPVKPEMPRRSGNPAVRAEYEKAMDKYRIMSQVYLKDVEAKTDERNLRFIQAAFVKAETPNGSQTEITLEGLEKFRRRPHGQVQTQLLIDKITALTTEMGEVEVPKSLTPSESSLG